MLIMSDNKSQVKHKSWADIKLKDFYNIIDIASTPDEYTELNLLDTVYGIDSSNMTLSELAPYAGAIEFLETEVPKVDLKTKYVLNSHIYESNFNLTTITVSQFIDYQNYLKQMDSHNMRFEKVLSVFFTPDGHTYNDGYDLAQLQNDLLELDMPTVMSLTFFFKLQLVAFVSNFQQSLKQRIKKMKLPKAKKQELLDQLEPAALDNLVSCL